MFILHIPSVQEPVTYSCRAKAVPLILANLTKATGVKMGAVDEAKEEIVYLHVDGLPLDSLMKKLAFVTSCEWETVGSGYRLKPAGAIRRREEEEDGTARVAKVHSDLQKQIDGLEAGKAKELEDGSGVEQGFQGRTNEVKLAALKLALLVSSDVGSFADGGEEVWVTNNPNDAQKLLPDEARDIMSQFLENYTHQSELEVASISKQLAGTGLAADDREELQQKLTDLTSGPLVPAKTFLDVRSGAGSLRFSMKCYDGKGKPILESQALTREQFLPQVLKKEAADPNLKPFQLSPDSELICRTLLDQSSEAPLPNMLSDAQLTKFSDLEHFDPLYFVPSDMVDAFRVNGHPQIVADLPDAMIAFADRSAAVSLASNGSFSQRAMDLILGNSVLKSSLVDSVTLLKPIVPSTNRAQRIDRAGYAGLLKDGLDHGCPTLPELAAYAFDHPSFLRTGFDVHYEMVFGGAIQSGVGRSSWPALRFFGSLTPEEQVTLEASGTIDLSTLSSIQNTCAYQLVFWGPSQIDAMAPIRGVEENSEGRIGRDPLEGTVWREKSELLPYGLNRGLLVGVAESEPVLMTRRSQSVGSVEAAMDIAQTKMLQEDNPASFSEDVPKKGVMGVFTHLELIFPIAAGVGAHAILQDVRIPKGASPVAFSDLPSEFLAKIAELLKTIRASQVSSGGEGKANPIP